MGDERLGVFPIRSSHSLGPPSFLTSLLTVTILHTTGFSTHSAFPV